MSDEIWAEDFVRAARALGYDAAIEVATRPVVERGPLCRVVTGRLGPQSSSYALATEVVRDAAVDVVNLVSLRMLRAVIRPMDFDQIVARVRSGEGTSE